LVKVNRDFVILLFGRLLQIGITLISLRVSTSLLPESELGLVYFIAALQTFFALFFIAPVGQYFNRQTNSWFLAGILKKCLFNQLLYVLFIATLSFFLLSLVSGLGVFDLSLYLILTVSCLVFSQSANQTIIPMFNMIENRAAFVLFSLITATLSAVFSCVLLLYWHQTALSWLMGIILGNMVVNIFSLWWLKYNIKESVSTAPKNNISNILSFSLPIALSTFFMWFLASGYRILIENTYGLSFLAILGVGLAVSGQLFAIVESLLTQYLTPSLYRKVYDASKDNRLLHINKYIEIVIPIYISLAIFLTFAVEYIFPFLVAEKYHSSYIFAIYAVWIELFRVLTNAFAITAQVEKKTSNTVSPYVFGAVILFSLLSINYYLKLDAEVMYLLIIANAIVLTFMMFKMYLLQKVSFPLKNTVVMAASIVPSILFFTMVDISHAASVNSFILLLVGGLICLLGFSFSFRALIHDKN